MASFLKNLRAYAQGALDESSLRTEDVDSYDFENDEEFMQECMAACYPSMVMDMILGESADELDESVKQAVLTLQDYMVGQGMINEAATMNINNPKINVVRLNKKAQLSRLTTIITLKMARAEGGGKGSKNYRKYKLGQKIKKENMAEMKKRYGAKAEKLAKKMLKKLKGSGKVNAVVDKAKK